MKIPEYPFEIRKLTDKEGGGILITFPDLPGCMSDGETIEEAIKNGVDAVQCWIVAAKRRGRKTPKPGETPSGRFNQRFPKSLQARLIARAKREGVSMNTLVTAFVAEALARKEPG
ncbi:MAG: type II toxin-antitoxin system HicB family antitoxin [Nitrospinae bacterium]|nr:type II toxin-antitoxin system HicB family antitoxin [Nitrospinota bacterium]